MNPFSIPPILSAVLFLLLGGFIFLKDKKSNIHLIFLVICTATAWWQASWFFLFNIGKVPLADLLVKIGHVGILLLPILFFHFVLSFLGKKKLLDKIILISGYLITLFLEINLFLTNNVIDGYYEYFWGLYPKANFLHPYFLLMTGLLLLRIIYLLISSIRKSEKGSLKKSQMEYILISILFYTFAASDFIVNYGFEFYPVGFIAILFFLGTIGYAIAKYRLMDVKIILTELLVSIIALVLFAQIFTAQTTFESIWKTALFISFLFLGYLLIRSVLQEVKRRTELQKLYQQVNKLSKAKSEFLSIASHQLRTPLTAVKGYISLILEGDYGKISERMIQPFKNVYRSNERLLKLVNDLLSLSRLESGKLELTLGQTSLEELISSIVEELKVNANKKGLYINIEKSSKSLPKISADKDKIRQVILNIIDNAIKYTENGGVVIKTEMTPLKEKIIISDTGDGMTEKEIGNAFQMFTRATAGIKNHTGGSGVGLYVAKKFIDMHNGKIWIESRGKGKGTTFNIELPIKKTKKNGKNT
ncbi:MAG: ATP-binding protein [bacterium]